MTASLAQLFLAHPADKRLLAWLTQDQPPFSLSLPEVGLDLTKTDDPEVQKCLDALSASSDTHSKKFFRILKMNAIMQELISEQHHEHQSKKVLEDTRERHFSKSFLEKLQEAWLNYGLEDRKRSEEAMETLIETYKKELENLNKREQEFNILSELFMQSIDLSIDKLEDLHLKWIQTAIEIKNNKTDIVDTSNEVIQIKSEFVKTREESDALKRNHQKSLEEIYNQALAALQEEELFKELPPKRQALFKDDLKKMMPPMVTRSYQEQRENFARKLLLPVPSMIKDPEHFDAIHFESPIIPQSVHANDNVLPLKVESTIKSVELGLTKEIEVISITDIVSAKKMAVLINRTVKIAKEAAYKQIKVQDLFVRQKNKIDKKEDAYAQAEERLRKKLKRLIEDREQLLNKQNGIEKDILEAEKEANAQKDTFQTQATIHETALQGVKSTCHALNDPTGVTTLQKFQVNQVDIQKTAEDKGTEATSLKTQHASERERIKQEQQEEDEAVQKILEAIGGEDLNVIKGEEKKGHSW